MLVLNPSVHSLYAFINVDTFVRPPNCLSRQGILVITTGESGNKLNLVVRGSRQVCVLVATDTPGSKNERLVLLGARLVRPTLDTFTLH